MNVGRFNSSLLITIIQKLQCYGMKDQRVTAALFLGFIVIFHYLVLYPIILWVFEFHCNSSQAET